MASNIPVKVPAVSLASLAPKALDTTGIKKAKLPKHDHRVKTVDQPKVTVTFNKEVASRGKLYEAGSTHDIPLDEAHSLAAHIVK